MLWENEFLGNNKRSVLFSMLRLLTNIFRSLPEQINK